jgi:transposase
MRVTDKPLRQLAKDLGVSEQTLRNWRRQTQVDQGERDGLSSAEREEIRELRKRLRTVEMEREVLRKAAAFFARESEGR